MGAKLGAPSASGRLEEALEPPYSLPGSSTTQNCSREVAISSPSAIDPLRGPGERAAKVVLFRQGDIQPLAAGASVPAFRFASSATARKYSACRR